LRYLLDTNVVSALMRGDPAVAERLAGTPRADVAITQLTVAEVEFGIRCLPVSNRRRVLRSQWNAIGAELPRLPWDDAVSRVFGEQKARLGRSGRSFSDFDLAIAAHAIAFGLILVTAEAAFARLGLRHESWLTR
jgi:tRNA(fMet)-specific endonuclease VapC